MQIIAALLACATAALAQRVAISAPLDQAHLTAGQSTVVEIDRPDFLSSAQEVAVVIGVQSCVTRCPAPSDTMGQVLYSGSYNPQRDPANRTKQPFQNFTVTVPSNLPKGPAQIGVAHFSLIGAGLMPFLETTNVSVIIQ
ncbi:hypothetical protein P691DRAFT_675614 [Macrolepiota fuliginosa MF-IS2]|uniref:Uncharacterized protein n=1 Tax=Macrolepiota fuliginosa MF-IS2 TaxID=1400762 RepID=A0A9P5X7F3_9AGAR|nr:hypothetical protein P691DRAFT_675614 [Macrolepiota fuliginosa MF-IS2]